MADTSIQATDASPNNRSREEKALRKAEKNRRKKERKKQERKCKAEEAIILAGQTPSLPKDLKEDLDAGGPTSAPAKVDASTSVARTTTRVTEESFKSARAHYSPVSAKVTSEHVGSPKVTSRPLVDEDDNIEENLGEGLATTQSPGTPTKEPLLPAGSQPSVIIPVGKPPPVISPILSVSEYENSVVMVDRPDLDSFNGLTFRKPLILDSVDSDDDGSIEDTIITQGAKAALSQSSKTLVPKPHLQAIDLSVDPDESDDEDLSTLGDSDPHGCEPEEIKSKRHTGFSAPEDLPKWFPRNIKQIYRVDRHGGALSFKELNEITRYRAALEKIRRQKWNTYIQAGKARWKLQKILRRLRVRPLTKAFYEYRNKQYKDWNKKALKSWKRLEKTHLGVSILDETININFRQERIIYEKKLGGRL
ncbi:hypothetical protein BKA64DRAFT_713320 [Cadophora sp. MPI-SDFR-AT-0126]|nr:hypothetical protein BKA64DRAFT_713320 [Leotiomycetes sp. MPI-SDFR-AT-0126]